MQSTKQAIFKLGEESYGLDIMNINSIEKPVPIEKAANAPANMKGMIILRGDKLPVYSLRKKFRLKEKEADEDTRLVVTNSNGITIAYEVDKMEEIVAFEEEQILDVPPLVKNKDTSYIKAVTKSNDHLLILMELDGILSEEEQSKIKAMLKQ